MGGRVPEAARGLPWQVVVIEEIDSEGVAQCLDSFGGHMNIPIAVTRAKGAKPAVGDQWVVDRALTGRWTFAAVINTVPPSVTGSRAQNAALEALLAALDAAGLIVDETTLGSAPGGGGGVTDHGALTGLADDDHPQYLREAEADLLYEAIGAASAAIIDHEGDPDPHPDYLTETEADSLYDAFGEAVAAVASHEADTTDVHDDTAISFDATGLVIVTGVTNVHTALSLIDTHLAARSQARKVWPWYAFDTTSSATPSGNNVSGNHISIATGGYVQVTDELPVGTWRFLVALQRTNVNSSSALQLAVDAVTPGSTNLGSAVSAYNAGGNLVVNPAVSADKTISALGNYTMRLTAATSAGPVIFLGLVAYRV